MDGQIRFILKVILAAILLSLIIGSVTYTTSQLGEGWGLFLGIIAAICLGFGVLLTYWTAVGWVNYRYIKRLITSPETPLIDGQVCAFSGTTKTVATPLIAPFSRELCAGYKYSVSHSRNAARESASRSSRIIDAEGLHLLPTTIMGEQLTLRLNALPDVDDTLKIDETKALTPYAIEYLTALIGEAPSASQITREAAKIKAELHVPDSIKTDFCMAKGILKDRQYSITEERIPIDRPVCVVGTYNHLEQSLTGEKSRFGPNIVLYDGTPEDVLSREQMELGKFTKIAAWMMAIYTMIMLYASFDLIVNQT